jgi:hypothetical protein
VLGRPDFPSSPASSATKGRAFARKRGAGTLTTTLSLAWQICTSCGWTRNDLRDRASFISRFAGIVRPSRKLVSGAQWPGDHRRWNQGSSPHPR